MNNLKKFTAGTAIALVIGASAIAAPMNSGIVSADGPSGQSLESDTPPAETIYRATFKADPKQMPWLDDFASFRTLAP